MSMITRSQRLNSEIMEEYKCSLLNALQDQEVIDRYRLIFEPIFKTLLEPVSNKLSESIRSLCQTFDKLRTEAREKDEKIHKLEQDVASLKVAVDNHEQHGRHDSVRIFGLSEETPGTTDDKVIRICNGRMQLDPPLTIDEISVSHRVGQPRQSPDESAPPTPRPLLVKFATRRSKNRVMAARKKLRTVNNRPNADPNEPSTSYDQQGGTEEATTGDDDEDKNWLADGRKMYIADDLTKMRANLAYEALKAKRNGEIAETWVIDTKIMIKTNHSRISQISSLSDLQDRIRHG